MGQQVLVAYATKHGATQEIAERVGRTLTHCGHDVVVANVNEVADVEKYGAVVVGVAVYIGKWRKEGVKFLKSNIDALAARPLWLFSSGPTGEGDPVELLDGWRYPESLKPVVDRIKPRDAAVFHGVLDPDDLNFVEKRMIKMVKAETGDFRDWEAIEEWARGIGEALGDDSPAAGAGSW